MKFRFCLFALMGVVTFLAPSSAFAYVSFSPPVNNVLVFFHVFGAIIFMGNIMVTAMWMTMAKRSRDTAVLHFSAAAVQRADSVFTIPGIILILVTGLLIVGPWGGIPGASWAELALALFILSGAVWLALVRPAQKRMVQIAREAVELKTELSDEFYAALKKWNMWGGMATLIPFIALVLMVFKPKLWG